MDGGGVLSLRQALLPAAAPAPRPESQAVRPPGAAWHDGARPGRGQPRARRRSRHRAQAARATEPPQGGGVRELARPPLQPRAREREALSEAAPAADRAGEGGLVAAPDERARRDLRRARGELSRGASIALPDPRTGRQGAGHRPDDRDPPRLEPALPLQRRAALARLRCRDRAVALPDAARALDDRRQ